MKVQAGLFTHRHETGVESTLGPTELDVVPGRAVLGGAADRPAEIYISPSYRTNELGVLLGMFQRVFCTKETSFLAILTTATVPDRAAEAARRAVGASRLIAFRSLRI